MQEVIAIIGAVLGVLGFIVAFATLWNKSHADVKSETAEEVEQRAGLRLAIATLDTSIGARLNTIDDGIRDLKADNRNMRKEFTAMRDEFKGDLNNMRVDVDEALRLSKAAHRRLDSAKIAPSPEIKE